MSETKHFVNPGSNGHSFFELLDVSNRGSPEVSTVLPAELRGALVAHLKPRRGGIDIVGEHESTSLLQAQSLLILEWAESGHGTEMLVESGVAHLGHGSQILNLELLGEILVEPIDSPRDVITLTSCHSDVTKSSPLLSNQESINDLLL